MEPEGTSFPPGVTPALALSVRGRCPDSSTKAEVVALSDHTVALKSLPAACSSQVLSWYELSLYVTPSQNSAHGRNQNFLPPTVTPLFSALPASSKDGVFLVIPKAKPELGWRWGYSGFLFVSRLPGAPFSLSASPPSISFCGSGVGS